MQNSNEKYNTPFAKRLRELIKENKVTIKSVADHVSITRQAISQYCDGSTQPNAENIVKIASYFNVSADYLLGISDNATVDADLQAVCKYTALSQKAIENIVQNKRTEQQYSIVSKVMESQEFWNIIGILKNATVNKAFLKPQSNYVKKSIISKFSDEQISTEFRQALQLIGLMGLSSAYKQQLTEELICLFNRLFEENQSTSEQSEE